MKVAEKVSPEVAIILRVDPAVIHSWLTEPPKGWFVASAMHFEDEEPSFPWPVHLPDKLPVIWFDDDGYGEIWRYQPPMGEEPAMFVRGDERLTLDQFWGRAFFTVSGEFAGWFMVPADAWTRLRKGYEALPASWPGLDLGGGK